MEWDEEERGFKNVLNLDEFISWLYPKEDEESDAFGSWDKRHLKVRDDLRTLSYLIKESPKHFAEFRRTKDLENCYAQALATKQEEKLIDQTEKTMELLSKCINAIDNIPAKALLDQNTKNLVIGKCKELLISIKDILPEAFEDVES